MASSEKLVVRCISHMLFTDGETLRTKPFCFLLETIAMLKRTLNENSKVDSALKKSIFHRVG
jgi:hypothetical protein